MAGNTEEAVLNEALPLTAQNENRSKDAHALMSIQPVSRPDHVASRQHGCSHNNEAQHVVYAASAAPSAPSYTLAFLHIWHRFFNSLAGTSKQSNTASSPLRAECTCKLARAENGSRGRLIVTSGPVLPTHLLEPRNSPAQPLHD